jgi:hypothetical protein
MRIMSSASAFPTAIALAFLAATLAAVVAELARFVG